MNKELPSVDMTAEKLADEIWSWFVNEFEPDSYQSTIENCFIPQLKKIASQAITQHTAELKQENDWLKSENIRLRDATLQICLCGCGALEGHCSTARLNDVMDENTTLKTHTAELQRENERLKAELDKANSVYKAVKENERWSNW